MKQLSTLLLLLLCSLGTQAQEIKSQTKLKGFVDSYHAMRTSSPYDWMSSRTRFRGELTQEYGKSTAFVSFNLNYNPLYKTAEIFELREAYLAHNEKHWGLQLGRQLVIWGVADGLRITDLVSPLDLSEFLARDYDDIRMPVNALRFFAFTEKMKAELIAVPTFQGFLIPDDPNNPWSIKIPSEIAISEPIPLSIPIVVNDPNQPSFHLKNIEFGGRVSFTLPGIDFSVAALHTWNKIPTMEYVLDIDILAVPPAKLSITPSHHRMSFIGADFSKPIGQFVFRGEAAFTINKHFSHDTKQELTPEKIMAELGKGNTEIKLSSTPHNTLNWLLGADWYAGNDWMLSAQFSSESIFGYTNSLEADKNSALATFLVSKELFHNSLKLSAFSYFDLKHKGVFARFSADYSLSDQIRLTLGYDLFHADDEKGMFSFYRKNSECWIKAKYSF